MKDVILQPSCSEAVARINLKDLTQEEINKLIDTVKQIEASDDECSDLEWGETSWSENKIFGNAVLEISGNLPYYNPDGLEKKLRDVLGDKLEIEFDEV